MKHTMSNVKAVAKPKTSKFNKIIPPSKIKSPKRIVSVNTALKSAKRSIVAKPKAPETKIANAFATKPKTKKINSKNPVKTATVKSKKIKSAASVKTSKSIAKKTKHIVSNRKSAQKTAPIKLVKPARTISSKTPKVEKIKLVKTVAPKKKISASAKKAAPIKKQKPSKISTKKVEKAKLQKLNILVKPAKTQKAKSPATVKRAQTISKKVKNAAAVSKTKNKAKKIKTIVSAKKSDITAKRIKTISTPKTGKTKANKNVSVGGKAGTKSTKTKVITPTTKPALISEAAQLVYSATTGKIIETKFVVSETKQNARKIKSANAARKENIIETTTLPTQKAVKNKKTKPIGTAVFRGKKERYDFKVFSIKEEIENIPAIYIISRRKTDKNNRGHHALVCIGQTISISDELKKHQKSKCVKKYDANVISILPEENEKKRLKIETDLRAAHTIGCNLK